MSPLVEIGLTDPPKSGGGGAAAPPASHLVACLLCKHILCTENKQSMLFSNPLPPKSAYVIYEWPLSEPETKAVKLATDYIIQDHGPDK